MDVTKTSFVRCIDVIRMVMICFDNNVICKRCFATKSFGCFFKDVLCTLWMSFYVMNVTKTSFVRYGCIDIIYTWNFLIILLYVKYVLQRNPLDVSSKMSYVRCGCFLCYECHKDVFCTLWVYWYNIWNVLIILVYNVLIIYVKDVLQPNPLDDFFKYVICTLWMS